MQLFGLQVALVYLMCIGGQAFFGARVQRPPHYHYSYQVIEPLKYEPSADVKYAKKHTHDVATTLLPRLDILETTSTKPPAIQPSKSTPTLYYEQVFRRTPYQSSHLFAPTTPNKPLYIERTRPTIRYIITTPSNYAPTPSSPLYQGAPQTLQNSYASPQIPFRNSYTAPLQASQVPFYPSKKLTAIIPSPQDPYYSNILTPTVRKNNEPFMPIKKPLYKVSSILDHIFQYFKR